MIDPMVSMALAVYSNKGAYALLLGSGISRASGIPTGWEVVIDLIRRVALLEGDNCEPDPAKWFLGKHKEEPDYSKLLDVMAKAPAERQRLLRSYFEPNDEERSQGLKLPSKAHKAIAQMAASGYVRVILTTNFDRLMERALEEVGIVPTVISTTDQIQGALPVQHAAVTVIKLHGDYLDTRIKNTEEELAEYDTALNKLLDRIFDDYGLIISGWSGDWDIALRAAIERCPNRRFSTFWTSRGALSSRGQALAEHRKATVIQAKGADSLFQTLAEKVKALEDLAAPHPLSAKMAAATVKRYLLDPTAKIRLHDLVHEETEKLFQIINSPEFGGSLRDFKEPADELTKRLKKCDANCEVMMAILVVGCYWGDDGVAKLWVKALQRIANVTLYEGGHAFLANLRRYPALLLQYAAGIAAIEAGNYGALATILTKPMVKNQEGSSKSIASVVYPVAVVEKKIANLIPGVHNKFTPLNVYIFNVLRQPLSDFLPHDEDYIAAFDRFEYMFGLVHADLNKMTTGLSAGWWGPVGCFHWRGRHFHQEGRTAKRIAVEIETLGENWGPLKAGLFNGSLQQAKTAQSQFDLFLEQVRFF